MAFRDNYSIRSKIVLVNKILGRVLHFRYLGCDVTCKEDMDYQKKGKSVLGNMRTFKI